MKCLPPVVDRLAFERRASRRSPHPRVARKRNVHRRSEAGVPSRIPTPETTEVLMAVIIGVDPHKATHTAVAVDHTEAELSRARVRATRKQVPQLLSWAEPLGERIWAIESAGGLGYLLAQQLVAAGEAVLDVPATLASRIRVLGTGRSDKNDPNDALSVAIAALRVPALREVVAADHAQVLRLLAKRNIDIGNHRTRVVCRLHNTVMELAPGGNAKELYASDAVALLDRIEPATPVEQARHDLAVELLADVQRLDASSRSPTAGSGWRSR